MEIIFVCPSIHLSILIYVTLFQGQKPLPGFRKTQRNRISQFSK